jgi:hypothetical protein
MRYALAVIAFVVSVGGAGAAEPLPKFMRNILYPEARASLLALGWLPAPVPASDRMCKRREATCGTYPEAESCAPYGTAVCAMLWRRGGQIIKVETIGDEDMLVRSVSCRVGC